MWRVLFGRSGNYRWLVPCSRCSLFLQSRILLTEDDAAARDSRGCDTAEMLSDRWGSSGPWCSIDRHHAQFSRALLDVARFLAICKRARNEMFLPREATKIFQGSSETADFILVPRDAVPAVPMNGFLDVFAHFWNKTMIYFYPLPLDWITYT